MAGTPSEQRVQETPREIPRTGIRGALVALEVPNFRLLFVGRVASNMSRNLRVFLRAWLTWEITHSPFLLGLVTSSLAWPMLIVPFFGGFLADRIDKRRLLMYTEVSLTIMWAVIAALIFFGYIQWWHFLISSVLSGIIQSLGRPGHYSIIGDVVDKRRLANAVSMDEMADTWPRIVGPALGGLLIGVIGAGWLFWLSVLGQGFAALVLFLMKWNPQGAGEKQSKTTGKGYFLEGFKHVWSEKALFGLVGLGIAFATIASSAGFLMPVFADAILGVGGAGLGYLMTASTTGASVGALIILFLSNFPRRGYLLMAVALFNVFLIFSFSRSQIFPLSLGIVLGMGMGQVMFRSMRRIVMQLTTPDDLRGRVLSFETTIQGMSWIGVLIMGSLAEYLSREQAIDLGFTKLGGSVASGAADTVLISSMLYGIISLTFFAAVPALRRFR